MELHYEPAALHRKQVKALFLSAFPKEERPPIRLLYRRSRQGKASFRAVMEGEKFVGLALTTGSSQVKTLMFLAIDDACRGKGYGSQVLRMMGEEFADVPFFLCAEPLDDNAPNREERVNRLRFYAGNGFEEIGLRVKEAGVEYTVLTPGQPLTLAQYREAVRVFFGPLRFWLICRS